MVQTNSENHARLWRDLCTAEIKLRGQKVLHYKIFQKLRHVGDGQIGEGGLSRSCPQAKRVAATSRISRCLDSVFAAGFQKAEPLERSESGRRYL